jgi:hypothetical protein
MTKSVQKFDTGEHVPCTLSSKYNALAKGILMRAGSTLTSTLTTLAAVAVIVACSSNNGKIGIGVQTPTAFQKALNACTDGMRSSQKVRPQAGSRTVELCEFPLKPDGTRADKTIPTTTDVSFSIQKGEDVKGRSNSNQVNLSMMIGFLPNVAFDDKDSNKDAKAKVDFRSSFAEDCQADTQVIFTRSKFGGPIQLHLSLNFQFDETTDALLSSPSDISETKTETDHEVRIEKQTEGPDTFWTLNQLPSLPKYYPHGKSVDNQACSGAGGSREVIKKCAQDHRKIVNLPVCAAFAKRVGNALGIVDAAKEYATCGAIQPVSTVAALVASAGEPEVEHGDGAEQVDSDVDLRSSAMQGTNQSKPSPTTSQDSSFSKPTASDDEFMKKAELNKKDLVTILAPACPNLKDAK